MSTTDPSTEAGLAAADDGTFLGFPGLLQRIVRLGRLDRPRTHKVFVLIVAGLLALCVASVAVRLSPMPLLPVPPLAVAAYAVRRVQREGEPRPLVMWTAVYLASTLFAFWLISIIPRWLDRLLGAAG